MKDMESLIQRLEFREKYLKSKLQNGMIPNRVDYVLAGNILSTYVMIRKPGPKISDSCINPLYRFHLC